MSEWHSNNPTLTKINCDVFSIISYYFYLVRSIHPAESIRAIVKFLQFYVTIFRLFFKFFTPNKPFQIQPNTIDWNPPTIKTANPKKIKALLPCNAPLRQALAASKNPKTVMGCRSPGTKKPSAYINGARLKIQMDANQEVRWT